MSFSLNDYIKYDLYNIFLLTKENFNKSLLRKAYQRQILIYHPDKANLNNENTTDEEKKEKYETFNLINTAYTILSDDILRNEYNELKLKFDLENTNFIDLKTQFKQQKKSVLPPDQINLNKFQQQMNEMNKNIEDKIDNTNDIENLYNKLESERGKSENEIKDFYKQNNKEYNMELLKTEKVNPSDNFKNELSNISNIRNVKLENNGSELYNSLYSNIKDDKYASFEEAFNLNK